MNPKGEAGAESGNTKQLAESLSVVRELPGRRIALVRKAGVIAVIVAPFSVLALAYLFSVVPDFNQFASSALTSPERMNEVISPDTPSRRSLPVDTLASVPYDLRMELMTPIMMTSAEFSRRFTRPIDQLCKSFLNLQLGKFTTMHNPVAGSEWICSSEVLPAVNIKSFQHVSSVFVWVRGTENRNVDLLRLKVNLTDPATSENAKMLALKFLDRLHVWLEWDMPEPLKEAVMAAKDISFSRYGISYEIRREWSSLPRLNIVIKAADRSGIVSGEEFATKRVGRGALFSVGLRGPLHMDNPRATPLDSKAD